MLRSLLLHRVAVMRVGMLVLAVFAASATSAGAVVGGTPVDEATVPWFATLAGCGGTLVAPDRVLTAAHCVQGKAPADLGTVAVAGVTRSAIAIALHPNWRHMNGSHNFLDDVALIALDEPVTSVAPVRLAATGPGAAASILGRGRPFAPAAHPTPGQSYDMT